MVTQTTYALGWNYFFFQRK